MPITSSLTDEIIKHLDSIRLDDDTEIQSKIDIIIQRIAQEYDISMQYCYSDFIEMMGETPLEYVQWNNVQLYEKKKVILSHIDMCDEKHRQANPKLDKFNNLVVEFINATKSGAFKSANDVINNIIIQYNATYNEVVDSVKSAYKLSPYTIWKTINYMKTDHGSSSEFVSKTKYSYIPPRNAWSELMDLVNSSKFSVGE